MHLDVVNQGQNLNISEMCGVLEASFNLSDCTNMYRQQEKVS